MIHHEIAPRFKKLFYSAFFLPLFIGVALSNLYAQKKSSPERAEQLWHTIERQLEQQPSDTAFHFILLLVRGHCDRDLHCLYQTYDYLTQKFMTIRNAPAAVYVSKEMVAIAQRQKDLNAEGEAYMKLYFFHTSLRYLPLAARDMENALALFEQTGNREKILKIKLNKLAESITFRKEEEIIPEMEALLVEAEAAKDTLLLQDIHYRLIELSHLTHRLEEMSMHIDALEALVPAKPVPFKTYWTLIYVAQSRAILAMENKNYKDAEHYFLKALRHAEDEPSPWVETDILLSLYNLESDYDNSARAKSYLERALANALKFEFDDLLIRIFSHKTEIAEEDDRYAEALAYKKKELYYDEKMKSKNAGFNLQNFYLELDKEKLNTEKALQETKLNFQEAQLRSYLAILILVLLLGGGFALAYYLQRRAKEKVAAQNTIIQKQSEVLQNLDAAKSRFFANVSHELRTPLTLMLGPVNSLIKENGLTDKQLKLLKTAKNSGENLQKLVTQILDLTKLEAGKMEIDEQPTVLSAFFQKELVQFESLAFSKQVEISFEIMPDRNLVANIDQVKYRQILHNLLSNALKFTPADGQVKVSLAIENDVLLLDVADTGAGIHPADLPHLFNRYFQTNQPDKPIEGGTGIGLAICHEYTQLFGGKISVESELGTGSVFRLALPLSIVTKTERSEKPAPIPAEQPSVYHPLSQENIHHLGGTPAADRSRPADSSEPKPTILVVEDQPELQEYIRFILEEKYHVLTAGNGQVALDFFRDEGRGIACPDLSGRDEAHAPVIPHPSSLIPDLVLSDLMMPVMDGYQLLEKLKSEDATRHIPVIMLTARADVRDKLKALRLGVDDYLLKPFDEEELLVRIENLLKHQAGRKEFIAENEPEKETIFLSESDRNWLETFEAYVQKHLSSDTLNIPRLAMEFAMSESTLLRQLKRLTGLSPVSYLQEMRLNEARHLLETRQYDSIARVASKVGYSDLNNFGRSFKLRFGKTPSDFISN